VVLDNDTAKSTPLKELPSKVPPTESEYHLMVSPAETPFKFTLPEAHRPPGLAVIVGATGAAKTVTVRGVLAGETHPEMVDHEIIILPGPD